MKNEVKDILFFWGIVITASIFMALLSGCGHNVITYGDGIQAEVGFIPDQYKIALTFRYGKILTACVRENAEVEMEGNGSGKAGDGKDEKSASAESAGKLKIKIGKQITGYTVDALKAGAKYEDLAKVDNGDKDKEIAKAEDAKPAAEAKK